MMYRTFLLAAVSLVATTAQAAITIYTDEAAWRAAVGLFRLEDFADATLAPGLSITSPAGSIGGGVFNDRVVRDIDITTFSFARPTTGAGGFWDLQPGGFGQGLTLAIALQGGGSQVISQEIVEFTGGFFGFTSTNPFVSVSVNGGTQAGVAETYTLDNFQWGVVPEPASWALLIAGFGLVGAAARRRRVVAA